MDAPKLTRRQFLKYSLTGLVGYVLLPQKQVSALAPPTADNEPEVLVGVVNRVQVPRTLFLDSTTGTQEIQFPDQAEFYRGNAGRVSLTSFASRDEVVVEGQWENTVFAGSALMTMYRLVEGSVLQRQGNRLETTNAIIQLMPNTMVVHADGWVPKTLASIAVGDNIIADVWLDPAARHSIVARIGVKE